MIKNKIDLLPLIFLVILFVYFAYSNASKPRVLIVQSHTTTTSKSSAEIDKVIRQAFNEKAWISTRWVYLGQRNKRLLWSVKQANNIVKRWKPTLIIAVGEKAQRSIAKNYLNDPKIKLIFAGIRGVDESKQYGTATNATGIVEATPFVIAKQIYGELFPHKKRVVVITDSSAESKSMLASFKKINWSPFNIIAIKILTNAKQWQDTIKQAQTTADLIFVLRYYDLESSDNAKPIITWAINNSRIPMVGFSGGFVDDGGAISIGTNHGEQGKLAVKLALQIIENSSAALPPVNTHTQMQPYIRESVFKQFFPNAPLPKMLVDFAKAQNTYYP
ncbi:ABC transporter substrate binding protein [uncultured Shewanella sp.]|uniref:ABC transporter substrate-binding protein n=1 Tax=uncultured Shewanella sp. TaxID=173975 RepID=UPI0026029948|nr:ABC transporter substrate binding protein [uncultured Shewanella sp.]